MFQNHAMFPLFNLFGKPVTILHVSSYLSHGCRMCGCFTHHSPRHTCRSFYTLPLTLRPLTRQGLLLFTFSDVNYCSLCLTAQGYLISCLLEFTYRIDPPTPPHNHTSAILCLYDPCSAMTLWCSLLKCHTKALYVCGPPTTKPLKCTVG